MPTRQTVDIYAPPYVDVGITNTRLFSNEVFTESTMKTSNDTIIATLRQR